ncbi:SPFH domain-containing protein [Lentilactobacillus buchneri]|uniref:Band 7 domain-containing protein n=1 Tax=Lentilactobacillus buchneri DSM 20057 TaxID=1423728 RepID=A0A4R5NR85_LENBU|nr:SPFH domain-containing protein [Lentilactobacillus buchneri]MCT3253575.1 SPFH domain-containing protein [Lentilactobacillus buchneri]MCT3548166.1 SPFH domain-containing protein [Lentilactobacillus buchneri]MCT3555753.1 SPFH domain-containing protein [Lentilactobacillus buchneri]MCT3556798.1 SPFH domain-containing protein [Lentilactobacillus buchneri]MCT3558818.1 SPFH domain-containing protein [Lentilactobacillus buchneri]
MKEKNVFHVNGYVGLIIALILLGVGGYLLWIGGEGSSIGSIVFGTIIIVLDLLFASSLTIIQPNEAKVLTFFGRYIGTIRTSGLFMTVPLTSKQTISLRVRNFNSSIIKVNDSKGNPVEIAAVIVYKVVDSAKEIFSVEDYEQFVEIQSESAIRHIASQYPYDSFDDSTDKLTLRGNATEVSVALQKELQDRLDVAGLQIIETRLTHLAYATEIANAMLQRQQATAILSARKIIVQGAVAISEDAVSQLQKDLGSSITDEQRMKMINNVLVSIITERGTQNVINTDNLD